MRILLAAAVLMGCSGDDVAPLMPDGGRDAAVDAAVYNSTCPTNTGSGDGYTTHLGSCTAFDGSTCSDAVQSVARPGCCDAEGGWHPCETVPTNWHPPYYDAGM